MVKFEQINKKRKPIENIAFIGFFGGILIFGILIYFSIHYDSLIIKYITFFILLLAMIGGLILKLPIKKHEIIGCIGFTKEYIEIQTFKIVEKIDISNIQTLEFQINGYEGQPYFSLKSIYPAEDGTSNFVNIQMNAKKRKIEFFLENKYDLQNLMKIIDFYSNRIEVIKKGKAKS